MTETSLPSQPDHAAAMGKIGIALLLTLALLSGLAPFAIDMYLPAFPQIMVELDTSAAGVQLSLTAFLIGAGLGQLLFGPLSDRVGRRKPLVAGMSLYLIASAATALAPTIEFFVTARFVQGFAAAAGMVISRAMVTDLAHGAAAARALSLVMLVGGIAPVIAPVIGSVLVGPAGWRGLLWIITALVAISFAAVLRFAPESRRPAARDSAPGTAAGSQARMLLSRAYLGNMLAFVLAFTTMMAYIAASPFLYQAMMGFTAIQYGLAFGLNALTLMAGGALSARLTHRYRVAAIARTGLLVNLSSIAVFALLAISNAPTIWLAVPLPIAVGSLGLVFGNTTALALATIPGAAGLGSAVLGALQHLLAGAAAPLVGIGGEDTAIPLAVTMLATSVAATLALMAATRGDRVLDTTTTEV